MKYSGFSIQSSVLCGLNLDAFDQSCEHPFDLDDLSFELSLQPGWHYPEISGETQKIFNLACGTHGYMQETLEIGPTPTPASLGDVGRNRIRRAANLGSQSKTLLSRKSATSLVDQQCQGVTLLPDRQFLEVLHDSSVDFCCTDY